MGEEMGKELGAWTESLPAVLGVLVWLGEVNTRWQYLIRYSVTTACTATPCGERKIICL